MTTIYDIYIGVMSALVCISVWVMMGKIGQLALIEAQEHKQIGFEHTTFKDYDTTIMCRIGGPIMGVAVMGMYVAYNIIKYLVIIERFISVIYNQVVYKVHFTIKDYKETLQNRWDK